MVKSKPKPKLEKPRLHLVFGGELKNLDSPEFRDPGALDVIGIFTSYDAAFAAWKSAAQRSVDNAMMRYFVVHIHHLLEPHFSGEVTEIETDP
jgi:hypothetical protein